MAKHITFIARIAAALMPALASAQTWPEGGVMSLTTATAIEYGAGNTWASKTVGPGAVACSNATFGDPVPGTPKSCRVKPRFSCLPSPLGEGTQAIFRSGTKGDLVAWYCPGQELPHLFVCLKATCGLVGTKRALVAFASNPSMAALEAAMATYTRNPYNDPELIAVWLPFASEIRATGEAR